MKDREYVPLQPWTCGYCHASGDVEIPAGGSSLDAILALAEAHKEVNPTCARRWGVAWLKVEEAFYV